MPHPVSVPLAAGVFFLALFAAPLRGEEKPPLKAGIIGLDTSHVVAFTQLLNSPKATGVLARVRVVAAYPGGSPDIPDSKNRLEGYTKKLRDEFHVEIVDSVDA